MAHLPASMEVRTLDDRISIIAVQGELSWLTEAALMDAYVRACTPDGGSASSLGAKRMPSVIVLDFNQMTYMNSGGIGLLVTLLIRMHRQQQRLFAYGLSEHYHQIFAITRLDEALQVFDSQTDALAAAARM